MPTQDPLVEIKIGYAQSAWRTGELKFSIKVDQDGSTYVQVYAYDPSNLRISGVMLAMGQEEWQDFMQVLHAVQAGITRLQQADETRVFAVPDPRRQR
ncbi:MULTISPECIES: hypothetical protein [Sorangium]|uniref:hypothetical protein n=1 Tax=Sorangium TaxID=39643 RepID=UPI003D9C48FC